MMPPLAKTIPLKILAVISLLLFATTPSWGADSDKGWTSAQNGYYPPALNEQQYLPEQKNPDLIYDGPGGLLDDDEEAVEELGQDFYIIGTGPNDDLLDVVRNNLEQPDAEQNDNRTFFQIEQSIADMQYNLGLGYYKAAFEQFCLAAGQDHVMAQHKLRLMYSGMRCRTR